MNYSIAHDHQAAPNVKQILAFPDVRDKNDFERDHLIKGDTFPYTPDNFDDKNVKGVFVKIRAVMDGDDKWIPIIRTADGTTLKAFFDTRFEIWEDAIIYARKNLKSVI